jgi:N-acetylneuraminic acid mutarotase
MATLGDKVVLFGGTGATGVLNDTWEWDGATWTERTPAVSPPPRRGTAMATLGNKVVLFGGSSGQTASNPTLNVMSDTWEWDGSEWTRNMAPGGPEARWGHAMATLGDKVMLFGGYAAGSVNDTWQWDGQAWMLVLPSCTTGCASDSPTPRVGHVMASREGSILLSGGMPYGDSGRGPGGAPLAPNGPTWEWNGGRWLPRLASPPVALSDAPVAGAGIIADRHVALAALGDRAVLWGDAAGTWEWDGTLWWPRDPSTSPPKRFGHAMAALGDKVILFGGIGLPSMDLSTVDTWQWDGTTWARLDPPTSPPWRTGAAMATLGNKVVLFGGGDSSFAPLADTWEWDGTTWTKRTPPMSPPARYEHALATVGNEVVLFGGMGETGVLDDTWTWDGATWTRLAPASKPAARRAHAMATLDDRIVLYAGDTAYGPSHDTWAFESGEWTQILPTTYPPQRGDHAMAAVAGQIVLVGGSDDRDIWLLRASPLGAPPAAGSGGPSSPPGGRPVSPGSGSGGVGGGMLDDAGVPGGGAGAGGPPDAGALGPGGGAGAAGPIGECNITPDCASGLTCDVNHHCVAAASPCAAPASAMITSFDTGSSLVDSPYEGADRGLTSPTISTASGALVITLDTGMPTTTKPYAFVGLPFQACTNASAYSGVKFKASGTLSAGCSIEFSAIDREHAPPATLGTCNALMCYGSSASFDLPATPTDVTILFVDQIGGIAAPGAAPVDPAQLLNLQWTVIPSTGGCQGTVTIDDVTFL